MITGKDEISLRILELIESGIKVKDIPQSFNVSIDQAKRLSRYLNFINTVQPHISLSAISKLKEMGLKVLPLFSLVKKSDWEGLEEILSTVSYETTRDDFKMMMLALDEKRERVNEFQRDVRMKIDSLEQKERQLLEKEHALHSLEKEVSQTVNQFEIYTEDTRDFLMEHIGFYEGKYCLIKRVDSVWQKSLREKLIIQYNEIDYVYHIPNLDTFIAEYERNANRGAVVWDWSKEQNKYNNSEFGIPSSEYYHKGTNLVSQSLKGRIDELKNQMEVIKRDKVTIYQEIHQLKNSSVKTFMEAVEKSNFLSPRELRLHGELQDKSAKWLYTMGYVVATEVVLPNGRRADVIGFNSDKKIVVIEAKASKSDFLNDKKWKEYLVYCDEFYFCIERHSMIRWTNGERSLKEYEEKTHAGLLELDGRTITQVATTLLEHQAKDRDEIIFHIMRSLSKKLMFGY
jgi:hypothetical protein